MRKEFFIFVLSVFLQKVSCAVEPPGGVTIPNTFERAATIRLTASPTAGATYEATFTTNTAGIPPLTVTFASTLFQASGLIPDIDYTVSVVAISGGERSSAVTTTATTQPAIPSGPPQNVALESSTPTTVTLTWSDPVPTEINDRDGITGYEVFVNDARRGTTPSRRYTFTELSPGQAYIFKIRAMNEQGTALERHAATFEGSASPGIPGQPSFSIVLPLFSLAFLVWQAPMVYVGDITAYEIRYTAGGVSVSVPQQLGTTKSYTVNNINNCVGRTHSVSIRARTSAGWGEFSSPVEFIFQPIVNVSVPIVDCNTVAVDYTVQPLPAISMAQVNTLRVDYHKTIGASEPIVLTADLGDNTRSGRLCVSGLEKGVSYDFGYTVSVDLIGLSVSPPGDFPQDIDVRIPSSCNTPEQVCQVTQTTGGGGGSGAAATVQICLATIAAAVLGAILLQLS
jgi:hypothetical protein